MKTSIGYPQTYYTVYLERLLRKGYVARYMVGVFEDIRDAVQAIVVMYRKFPGCESEFTISSSTKKPDHWLIPTKYRD